MKCTCGQTLRDTHRIKHRIVCGDSTKAATTGKLLKGESIDMLLTDPPYGVAYVGKTKDALKVSNDALDETALAELIAAAFDIAEGNCRAGAYWYATVPPGPPVVPFVNDWHGRGVLRQILVWAKDAMVLGHSEYHYKHEFILFGWKAGKRHKNGDRTRTSLWQCDRPKASREHPTIKPVELWARAMTDGSRPGELVFDPFIGSGTTMIAAENLGRVCYGVELEAKYTAVVLERMKDLGLAPRLQGK